MRELKFKAYSHNYDMIFDVTHIDLQPVMEGYVTFEGNEGDPFDATFDGKDYSLMEFTGLYDKEGNEIYEGFLISDGKYYENAVIYSLPGGFGIKAPHWAKEPKLKQGDELIMQPLIDEQTLSYIKDHCKITGNIYQNKELLK